MLDARSVCCDILDMNGKEFIRRTTKWARANGLPAVVESSRGKGGHQLLHVGDRRTTVQTGEIKPGTFHAMLKQLGIPKEDF